MSYPTQWSCGHEWEGKRGRFPVPADIFILSMYNPAPMGAFKALLPKKIVYHIAVVLYRQCLQWLYIYIHIYIFRFISCVMFLCWCFLHVWCIPQQNSQRQFWSSVCEWQAENKSRGLTNLFAFSPLLLARGMCIHPMIFVAVGYLQLMEHATRSFVRSVTQFLWHHWRHLLQPLWYALLSLFFKWFWWIMMKLNNFERLLRCNDLSPRKQISSVIRWEKFWCAVN